MDSTLFGKPGEGAHALRVFGLPIVDWIGTIGLAALVTWMFKVPFELSFTGFLLLGILLHWVFGVQTATTKFLS